MVTYQQNLYGAQYVHGSSEGGSQVETETHCSSELWTQRSGDHIVGAARCGDILPRLDFINTLSDIFHSFIKKYLEATDNKLIIANKRLCNMESLFISLQDVTVKRVFLCGFIF